MNDFTTERAYLARMLDVNDDTSDEDMVMMVKAIFDSGFIDVLKNESPAEAHGLEMTRMFMIICGESL